MGGQQSRRVRRSGHVHRRYAPASRAGAVEDPVARGVYIGVVCIPRRARLPAAVLAAALVLSGCGADRALDSAPDTGPEAVGGPDGGTATTALTQSSPRGDSSAPSAPPEAAPAPQPPCESPLDQLSQRQRIAQLFTVGVSSMADARRAVRDHGIGGIFLGGDVVGEVVAGDGLARLKHDSPLPLLVAIDEEGGRVSRVAPFAGPLPSARVMAATMSPEQVRAAARTRGEFLRGMGVTVDFAPSVDVSAQPDRAVIGDRSFSADPARVVAYARAFADGLRDAGITPVFKHFPGHGRSSGDSHHHAVTVPPLDQLLTYDLRPFAELAGTPGAGMMLGHQQVPGLTAPGRPASLSPAAYRLLREGRGYGAPPFDGPTFTDDLSGMRAVTDGFGLPRAVVESLIAGADSPLWITTAGIPDALDAVERALAEGQLARPRLDRALERMAALRGIPGCLSSPVTGRVAGAGSLAAPSPDLPPRPDLPRLPA